MPMTFEEWMKRTGMTEEMIEKVRNGMRKGYTEQDMSVVPWQQALSFYNQVLYVILNSERKKDD